MDPLQLGLNRLRKLKLEMRKHSADLEAAVAAGDGQRTLELHQKIAHLSEEAFKVFDDLRKYLREG